MGVDTPSALASFASRWGGNGDFGGHHVGDKAAGLGDRCGERGVPLSLDITRVGCKVNCAVITSKSFCLSE